MFNSPSLIHCKSTTKWPPLDIHPLDVSEFLIGRLENSLLPEVRAVGLGCDIEVASAKLAELALPGHRGQDNARGTGMRPVSTKPQCCATMGSLLMLFPQ